MNKRERDMWEILTRLKNLSNELVEFLYDLDKYDIQLIDDEYYLALSKLIDLLDNYLTDLELEAELLDA